MKKSLIILASISLVGCSKRVGPDASMAMEGQYLRLPPEYVLKEPSSVNTVREDKEPIEKRTQKILLNSTTEDKNKNVNLWLMKNAGGQSRVKNIKQILDEDNKTEINN